MPEPAPVGDHVLAAGAATIKTVLEQPVGAVQETVADVDVADAADGLVALTAPAVNDWVVPAAVAPRYDDGVTVNVRLPEVTWLTAILCALLAAQATSAVIKIYPVVAAENAFDVNEGNVICVPAAGMDADGIVDNRVAVPTLNVLVGE